MIKLKIGIIGLGEVAQIIHLPILDSMSDRYEIAALCDISPQLLKVMGEKYNVNVLFTEAEELVAYPGLDAVFVLNSNEYHADCTIAAASKGLHVLVEKPMCITEAEADAIIQAKNQYGVKVMVGYMRRFAPAFLEAVEQVRRLDNIVYAHIRDIIGQNSFFIDPTSVVHRYNDIPSEASRDKAERSKRLLHDALGDASDRLGGTYQYLLGMSSHDFSAMRELIGMPKSVKAASTSSGGQFIHALLEFDGFIATFESGIDHQGRFDAHLEVNGDSKSVKVQYNTPYIRHLPTTMTLSDTVDGKYTETIVRPTYKDAYTVELEYFYEIVTKGLEPKTSPEDFKNDLAIFRMIIDAIIRVQ